MSKPSQEWFSSIQRRAWTLTTDNKSLLHTNFTTLVVCLISNIVNTLTTNVTFWYFNYYIIFRVLNDHVCGAFLTVSLPIILSLLFSKQPPFHLHCFSIPTAALPAEAIDSGRVINRQKHWLWGNETDRANSWQSKNKQRYQHFVQWGKIVTPQLYPLPLWKEGKVGYHTSHSKRY